MNHEVITREHLLEQLKEILNEAKLGCLVCAILTGSKPTHHFARDCPFRRVGCFRCGGNHAVSHCDQIKIENGVCTMCCFPKFANQVQLHLEKEWASTCPYGQIQEFVYYCWTNELSEQLNSFNSLQQVADFAWNTRDRAMIPKGATMIARMWNDRPLIQNPRATLTKQKFGLASLLLLSSCDSVSLQLPTQTQ